MGDSLLENYNPLYDVHLRQYFASPHMQKHLRHLGLIDSNGVALPQQDGTNNVDSMLYARHQVMMDMMTRNRERVLSQLADLQKKYDAAEKVEIYRRIRSGVTNEEEFEKKHMRPSRSLSRPARGEKREGGGRQRRFSGDDSDVIRRVETDFPAVEPPVHQGNRKIFDRLAASVYKYQHLHKLDDRTLINYKNSLKKQLQRLERFREVSFGPYSLARHQPQFQPSWFFRRRSLPSLTASAPPNTLHAPLRSLKSLRGRAGKSSSPRAPRLAASLEGSGRQKRAAVSRTRGNQRLPPLPRKPKSVTSDTSSEAPAPKLPPTAIIRPTRSERRPVPSSMSDVGIKSSAPSAAAAASPPISPKLPAISPTPVATVAGVAAVAAPEAEPEPVKTPEVEQTRQPSPPAESPEPAAVSPVAEEREPSPVHAAFEERMPTPAESEPQHEEPEIHREEPSPVPTPQEPEHEREPSPVESARYEESPRESHAEEEHHHYEPSHADEAEEEHIRSARSVQSEAAPSEPEAPSPYEAEPEEAPVHHESPTHEEARSPIESRHEEAPSPPTSGADSAGEEEGGGTETRPTPEPELEGPSGPRDDLLSVHSSAADESGNELPDSARSQATPEVLAAPQHEEPLHMDHPQEIDIEATEDINGNVKDIEPPTGDAYTERSESAPSLGSPGSEPQQPESARSAAEEAQESARSEAPQESHRGEDANEFIDSHPVEESPREPKPYHHEEAHHDEKEEHIRSARSVQSEAAPATPEAYTGHDEEEAVSHRSPSGASFEAPVAAEEPTPEEERPVGDFEDVPNDAISQENGLDAEEAEHIRQVVHHTADKTPSESVRSLDGSFRPPHEEPVAMAEDAHSARSEQEDARSIAESARSEAAESAHHEVHRTEPEHEYAESPEPVRVPEEEVHFTAEEHEERSEPPQSAASHRSEHSLHHDEQEEHALAGSEHEEHSEPPQSAASHRSEHSVRFEDQASARSEHEDRSEPAHSPSAASHHSEHHDEQPSARSEHGDHSEPPHSAASHRTEQEDAASEHHSAHSEHEDHHGEPERRLSQEEHHFSADSLEQEEPDKRSVRSAYQEEGVPSEQGGTTLETPRSERPESEIGSHHESERHSEHEHDEHSEPPHSAASHRTEQEDAASEHPSARPEHGDHHSEQGSELHQSEHEQHISPEPAHVISSEHSEHSAHFEPEHEHAAEEHDLLHTDEELKFPSPREETPRSIPDTAASTAPHETPEQSPRAVPEADSLHGHPEEVHASPVQSDEGEAASPPHNASAMPQPEADESGPENGYDRDVPQSAIPPASSSRLRLPSQPSIEITPASEYGGSAEEIDRLSDARTPLDTDSVREEGEHHDKQHEESGHDQVVPEHHSNGVEHALDDDDLVSSSPVHENGHTNGLHQHHGHDDDAHDEETHEKSSLLDRHSDNEDNESTGSVIIHDGKGSNGGYHRLPTDGEVGGSEI